jgi:hypothetical protein
VLHCSGFDRSGPCQTRRGEIPGSVPDRPRRAGENRELHQTQPLGSGVVGGHRIRVSAAVNHDAEDAVTEARDSKAYGGVSGGVAGILYKWVNYGKGRRSRWFALEDGVKDKMRIY